MINCYQFRNSISNFIDEDITFKNRQDFKQHLADCPACRKIYQSVLATRQSMRHFPQISVTDNFKLNLRNRILSDRNAAFRHNSQKSFTLNRIPSFAYGFAAAIVAVVAGIFILQSQNATTNLTTPPPIVRQQMTQPPAVQPQKIAPANSARTQPQQPRYTSAGTQPVRIDTIATENAPKDPVNDYQQNYEDRIKTVKDQR